MSNHSIIFIGDQPYVWDDLDMELFTIEAEPEAGRPAFFSWKDRTLLDVEVIARIWQRKFENG